MTLYARVIVDAARAPVALKVRGAAATGCRQNRASMCEAVHIAA